MPARDPRGGFGAKGEQGKEQELHRYVPFTAGAAPPLWFWDRFRVILFPFCGIAFQVSGLTSAPHSEKIPTSALIVKYTLFVAATKTEKSQVRQLGVNIELR